ncbi:MAG: hypothetical protein ACYTEL_15125 [Planctomycetota bacterium]|jgi:hypothetical protein
MKRLIVALMVLGTAAPVLADVVISVSAGPGPNDVTICYDASSEPNRVRMFSLDIAFDIWVDCFGAWIAEVNCVNRDYYIYPGSINIDASGDITDWGSCMCDSSYPGTWGGIDSNQVTIEMGSLYVGEGNAPAKSGDLVIITLDGCGHDDHVTVEVSENVIRRGVVMENPDEMVTVDLPRVAVQMSLPTCWEPVCWETRCECAGQPSGDGTCDGSVNLADLFALKAAFGMSAPWSGNECCSDYNHDQSVNLGDLFILKTGFGSSGYVPSTGNQNCE